jgi:hypothetical protein
LNECDLCFVIDEVSYNLVDSATGLLLTTLPITAPTLYIIHDQAIYFPLDCSVGHESITIPCATQNSPAHKPSCSLAYIKKSEFPVCLQQSRLDEYRVYPNLPRLSVARMPNLFVAMPAKKPTTANVLYSATFALFAGLASPRSPPPRPFKAFYIPGQRKLTKATRVT